MKKVKKDMIVSPGLNLQLSRPQGLQNVAAFISNSKFKLGHFLFILISYNYKYKLIFL
jgi:hypothetical protein